MIESKKHPQPSQVRMLWLIQALSSGFVSSDLHFPASQPFPTFPFPLPTLSCQLLPPLLLFVKREESYDKGGMSLNHAGRRCQPPCKHLPDTPLSNDFRNCTQMISGWVGLSAWMDDTRCFGAADSSGASQPHVHSPVPTHTAAHHYFYATPRQISLNAAGSVKLSLQEKALTFRRFLCNANEPER